MSRTFLLFIFLFSLAMIALGVAWNNGQIPREWTDAIRKYIDPNYTNTNSSISNSLQTSSFNSTSSVGSSGSSPADPPANAQERYSGQGPFSSRPFTTGDQWEVDWDSLGPLTVTLCRLDGTPDQVIGQQDGPSHGSSFQPKGGQYYLKISGTSAWTAWTVPLGNGASSSPTAMSPSAPGNRNPFGVPPASGFNNPANSLNNGDNDYIQKSIVIVRGDEGVGTGFLAKMGDSTCVITNQHVVADNPRLTIQTLSGQNLQVTGAQAAVDRDLISLTVQDDGTLPTMPLATSVSSSAQPSDPVLVPGNSQGGDVVVNTPGTIVGIGPLRVEVTNPVFPGNSGSPVVDLKLKQAVGVIAEAEKSDDQGWLNQYSMANQASAVHAVRYYSVRVDNVASWETVDLQTFYRQTHFISDFHEQSMELASFMIALASQAGSSPGSSSDISPTLYKKNPKLSDLMDQFNGSVNNTSQADIASKIQQYFFILDGISQTDVATMSNPTLFYRFNREHAKEEVALRKFLSDGCHKAFQDVTSKMIGQ